MKKSLIEFLEEIDEGELRRDREMFLLQFEELLQSNYFDFNAVNSIGENALSMLATKNTWRGFNIVGDSLNPILLNTDLSLMDKRSPHESFLMLALKHDYQNLKLTSEQYDYILRHSSIEAQYNDEEDGVYDALRYYMLFPYASPNFNEKHLSILVNKTINAKRSPKDLEIIVNYLYQDDNTVVPAIYMFDYIWPHIEEKQWFIQLLKDLSSPLIEKSVIQKYMLEENVGIESKKGKTHKI